MSTVVEGVKQLTMSQVGSTEEKRKGCLEGGSCCSLKLLRSGRSGQNKIPQRTERAEWKLLK